MQTRCNDLRGPPSNVTCAQTRQSLHVDFGSAEVSASTNRTFKV